MTKRYSYFNANMVGQLKRENKKLKEENEQLKQQKDKWKQQCIHFKEMLDDMRKDGDVE